MGGKNVCGCENCLMRELHAGVGVHTQVHTPSRSEKELK